MKQAIFGFVLLMCSFSAFAVECISSKMDSQPVLLFGRIDKSSGGDTSGIEEYLRARLASGGKYKVLLSDQYSYAKKSGKIDACTPVFLAEIIFHLEKYEPGEKLLGGLLSIKGLSTRANLKATISMYIYPERVTLEEFEVVDTSQRYVPNTKIVDSYKSFLELIAAEFEKKRDGFVQNKTPGF